MFKHRKLIIVLMTLLLAVAVLIGCSQPAAQPDPAPSTPTVKSNFLKWDEWSAKMSGTIKQDYYVVDLRSPEERENGNALPGSINIDANNTLAKGNVAIIDEKLAGVPKDAVILIHCRSGARVKANLAAFLDKGYVNAFGLDGRTAFD